MKPELIPHHGAGLVAAENDVRDATDDHKAATTKHSHYKKEISHLSMLDIYRVLSLFEVKSHAVGHAIKKLIMAGKRGSKGYEQDIREAVDSLNRELQMIAEDK